MKNKAYEDKNIFDPQLAILFRPGDKVNFKGSKEFYRYNNTHVQAILPHMMLHYLVEHPMGNITRETLMDNGSFEPGFENYFPTESEAGKRYISVSYETLEMVDSKYCQCETPQQNPYSQIDIKCTTCKKEIFSVHRQ